MNSSPRLAAAEELRQSVVLVDILEQQMLDLKALREEVAAAESAAAMKKKHQPPQNAKIWDHARKYKLVD